MNSTTLAERNEAAGEIMESVLVKGDLAKLTPAERTDYYMQVCRSIGLNPLTQPFSYIVLNGKLTLYAKRDAADQQRKINGINIEILDRSVSDGLLTVHVRATDRNGRTDEDFGVVPAPAGSGEIKANAMLKAVTKAKRRVTLSISGLGFLDETEVDDIPTARRPPKPMPLKLARPPVVEEPAHDPETGEIEEATSEAPAVEEHQQEWAHGGSATARPAAPAPKHTGTGAGAVPTADEYVERWDGIIQASTRADQLAAEWNGQKSLRNKITWPEDGTFEALRARVTTAIENLRS